MVVASFLLFSTVVLIASKLLSTTTNGQNFNVIQTVWFYLLIGLVLQFLIMLFCVVRQLPNVTVNPWASDAVRSFLRKRSIKTDSAVEAISLGIMNVLANSWLLVLPLTILALILLANLKLLDLGLFSLMIGLPILIFYICLSLKIKISQIHLFLINNAYFLRLVSFLTLLILGLLVFYARIIGGG